MANAADRMNWLIRHRVCILAEFAPDETRCPSCGHAVLAHIGVQCCAICEMRAEMADLRAARAVADADGSEEGSGG